MTAQIIDFAQKRREKLEREWLNTDVTALSPEDLKNLQISLRQHIIANADEVLPDSMIDGHITIRINGLLYTIPTGEDCE